VVQNYNFVFTYPNFKGKNPCFFVKKDG